MTPTDQAVAALDLARRTGIRLNTENAAPPVNSYIGVDDQLIIILAASVSAVPVSVNLRLLRPDGSIVPNVWNYTTTVSRSGIAITQQVTEGFILSAVVTGGVTNVTRSVYATLMIARGGTVSLQDYQVLCEGYISAGAPLSWPTGVNMSPVDCAGNIRSITGTLPAAGADISESVPAGAKWRLIAFRALLTTNATAGTRTVFLTFDDGTNVFCDVFPVATQPASVTVTWSWADGIAQQNTSIAAASAALPRQMFLMPGFRIRTLTSGLLSTDQWTAPQYLVEEWLLP